MSLTAVWGWDPSHVWTVAASYPDRAKLFRFDGARWSLLARLDLQRLSRYLESPRLTEEFLIKTDRQAAERSQVALWRPRGPGSRPVR